MQNQRCRSLRIRLLSLSVGIFTLSSAQVSQTLMNEPLDLSNDFKDYRNTYFLADSLKSFDPLTATGEVIWRRSEFFPAHAFDFTQNGIRRTEQNEFPAHEYARDPSWPFSLEFVSARTVRLQMSTGVTLKRYTDTLMIPGGNIKKSTSWIYSKLANGHQYKSQYGMVRVYENPWGVEFFDQNGKSLTKTTHSSDNKGFCANLPFCYVRRASDYSRSVGAVFSLSPDEKIFGCGESFTKLNKYGQKVNLYTCDPNGVETASMYKPIPFYMSSRGYGVFMHTSTPITCDFGNTYGASNAMWIGDEALDLFVFLGEPKDILDQYTDLTGKASMPPLWSFGLWMSRITYFSEQDGRQVAAKLRANAIPT
ncbi:MAG: alpha-xylosidase, partial [Saprospiraceae bacterium]|nr:alpha-xylosidase [Saprospiraceae bacterium]